MRAIPRAMLLPCTLFLIGINAVTSFAFAIDKRRAAAGEWRIGESTLLSLALIGGSPGAFWARARFRHKTSKQPFSHHLHAIAVLQAAVLVGLGVGLAPAMA